MSQQKINVLWIFSHKCIEHKFTVYWFHNWSFILSQLWSLTFIAQRHEIKKKLHMHLFHGHCVPEKVCEHLKEHIGGLLFQQSDAAQWKSIYLAGEEKPEATSYSMMTRIWTLPDLYKAVIFQSSHWAAAHTVCPAGAHTERGLEMRGGAGNTNTISARSVSPTANHRPQDKCSYLNVGRN